MGLRESIENAIKLERFVGEPLTQETLKTMKEYISKQLSTILPQELNKFIDIDITPDPKDPSSFRIDFRIKYLN